ncbi:type II toxin-antitoxin system HicB family antitoxin [Candidatus Falkowbacteria bacterium]|nr:type II toxin-antitoxin system HicB family antitoxin [Candidatus Falkowbacteria bacterium]
MKGEFTVIIEKDPEGYLVASVPELPGCHTQATTFDQLNERIKEAIELCILENEGEIDRNQFVGML